MGHIDRKRKYLPTFQASDQGQDSAMLPAGEMVKNDKETQVPIVQG
jgi:hypothetical protein